MKAVGQTDVRLHLFLTANESARDNLWTQTLSEHFEEDKNLLPLSEIEKWFLGDRLVA